MWFFFWGGDLHYFKLRSWSEVSLIFSRTNMWPWTGFGLVNRFIDRLYTRLISTSNYSATADIHNSQITTALAKLFPACYVYIDRSLATAANSRDSSTSRVQAFSSQPPVQNSTESEVKIKVTLRLTVSKSWCRGTSGAHDQIFITVWQLRSCFLGAPSLTRGQVCLLYMRLVLTSAVFLGFESLWTRDHILLSQIWGFHFHRLLRLAGSRWRYSTPPPQGLAYNISARTT
jgi:hypothetical protein